MIVGEQKKIDEILRMVEPYASVAVVACGTCVAVSMAGGEKEALKIASLIRKHARGDANVTVKSAIRQCDMEFLDELDDFPEVTGADCVLSLGCGAGVQFMAEKYPYKVIVPGINTTFIGVNRALGVWTEMCQGCGDCVLEKTGGICPVSRCSKSHFNGPCGGSSGGRCEIDPETDCAWQLIYDRLKRIGQTHRLLEINPVRDWRSSRDGGPRKLVRADAAIGDEAGE
jgi:NAD-dependent dihydropyrimidine dehydrogenase PreA subunit